MKKLKIHYQNERKHIRNHAWYPEDRRTPKKRVEYVKELSINDVTQSWDEFILVSACPYIVEAFVKYFKDWELECYIDGVRVNDVNEIFKEFAEPMQTLTSVSL